MSLYLQSEIGQYIQRSIELMLKWQVVWLCLLWCEDRLQYLEGEHELWPAAKRGQAAPGCAPAEHWGAVTWSPAREDVAEAGPTGQEVDWEVETTVDDKKEMGDLNHARNYLGVKNTRLFNCYVENHLGIFMSNFTKSWYKLRQVTDHVEQDNAQGYSGKA